MDKFYSSQDHNLSSTNLYTEHNTNQSQNDCTSVNSE